MKPKVKGNFVKVLIIKILFVTEKIEKKMGAVMMHYGFMVPQSLALYVVTLAVFSLQRGLMKSPFASFNPHLLGQ